MDNNVSREFLETTFGKFGPLVEIVMEPKKSYCFLVYENKESIEKAINELQGREINWPSQTPICYYLMPVDRVPTLCQLNENSFPQGLILINNFIDESYAREISDFLHNDGIGS